MTSASATQIVTAVPAGATTGFINVTTPAGSASGGVPFTMASTGPVIDGFAPTVGAAGTSVNINGSNFEPVPSGNRVTINGRRTSASAATTTSITTAVPAGGTSGRGHRPAGEGNPFLDGLQLALDIGGMVLGLGEPLDLINAGISALRGDYVGAGLSLAGAIPIAGNAATGAKLLRKGANLAGDYGDDLAVIGRQEETAACARPEVAQALKRFPARSPEDKSIAAMGYEEGAEPDGFRYQRGW